MVKLAHEDIKTREVLDWNGIHLLHAPGSSCSQKVRIFLNLKGLDWQSHIVDLKTSENFSDWYLGINPRGLVPCLIMDGEVHIESNDILRCLEAAFPEPSLIPSSKRGVIWKSLRIEDELHLDLRVLTFRYIIPSQPGQMKDPAALSKFAAHDGQIQGQPDHQKRQQVEFWKRANAQGITDDQVAGSARRFYSAFNNLNETLKESSFVAGQSLSVADIAWYIYAVRLVTAGYPLCEFHTHVADWFARIHQRPEFRDETKMPERLKSASARIQDLERAKGTDLAQYVFDIAAE